MKPNNPPLGGSEDVTNNIQPTAAPTQPTAETKPSASNTPQELVGYLGLSIKQSNPPMTSVDAKSMYNSITTALGPILTDSDAKDIISKIQGAVAQQGNAPLAESDTPGELIIKKGNESSSDKILNNPAIKKILEHLKLTNEHGDLPHNVCEAIHVYESYENAHPTTKLKLSQILENVEFLLPENEEVFDENSLDETAKSILEVFKKIGDKNKKKDDFEEILANEKNKYNKPE